MWASAARGAAGLLLIIGGAAAAAEPTDEERRILEAIEVMSDHPLSQEATRAQGEVVTFARQSSRVSVQVSPELFLFAGSPYDNILLAHYIAGAVKFDLEHPKQAKKEFADAPAALAQALRAYRWLKASKIPYDNAFFEGVDAGERRGDFDKLAKDLVSRARASPKHLTTIGR